MTSNFYESAFEVDYNAASSIVKLYCPTEILDLIWYTRKAQQLWKESLKRKNEYETAAEHLPDRHVLFMSIDHQHLNHTVCYTSRIAKENG